MTTSVWEIANELVSQLTERGETVATAESLTGGLVCAHLVDVPGASSAVRGGIVAYDTRIKASLLGVSEALLEDRGAVDPDVAESMGAGVRERMGSTYGLATTGVAGPEPQDGKPVGTVYVAVVGPEGSRVRGLALDGDRVEIRRRSVEAVLELLGETLAAEAEG
ncbi:MAG TPA: CinA family protein [Segeticoccus sp.]|uniref:CinA family protein n=1 Tax=Segeticoccus sp. TaxID=2706531 RepID=UPI002D80598B|nr:CinA family protein [Segeticoccus sp.]HET8598882.1 CinA family protein [Segeticoccus sp.]